MKLKKSIVLLSIISALSLTGCGDSGFKMAHKTNDPHETDNSAGNDHNVEQTAQSGGIGTADDERGNENKENQEEDNTPVTPAPQNTEPETPVIDLGTKISVFKFKILNVSDSNYIYVSSSENPLAEKYEYSYYTVNDEKKEANQFLKEDYEGEEAYKITLDDSLVGEYSIKFYNKDSTQYGRADVSIEAKVLPSKSFVVNSINVVQVQWVSMLYNIGEQFKKIGDFFKSVFNDDKIQF